VANRGIFVGKKCSGGGLDWFLYREEILHDYLYPFIEMIQPRPEDIVGSLRIMLVVTPQLQEWIRIRQ